MDYIRIETEKSEERLLNIGELYNTLEQVPDNRQQKGKRYTIGILLMVVILGKLCGENTPYGIAEWAKMRATELQNLFGYHRPVKPSNQNEVLLPFTGGSTQAAVSGNGRHQKKVDTANLELANGAQSVGDTL